jgi:transcriptional regulator GlxA family with amidase domain
VRIGAARRDVDKVSSDKSMAEIGLETRFSHHAHFTHTFKEHLGLTPFSVIEDAYEIT